MQYKALASVALALATASGFAEGTPVSSPDQLDVVKRGTPTSGGNRLETRKDPPVSDLAKMLGNFLVNGNDIVLCGFQQPVAVGDRDMAVDGSKHFEEARQNFCNLYNVTAPVVPQDQSTSAKINNLEGTDGKPATLTGTISNTGGVGAGTSWGVKTGYQISTRECLDLTAEFTKNPGCVQNGATRGGTYYQNTWGVSFSLSIR